LSVALKILALLERQVPGISRPTSLRASRYNQDLHPGMLLVEVGSSGNTLAQAKAAVDFLAEAIIQLKDGANLGT
jgi:stage II sporulation protein P